MTDRQPDVAIHYCLHCEGFLVLYENDEREIPDDVTMLGDKCPCGAETYPVWKTLDKGEVGYLNHKNTVNESHVVEMTDPRFKPIAESCQNANDD